MSTQSWKQRIQYLKAHNEGADIVDWNKYVDTEWTLNQVKRFCWDQSYASTMDFKVLDYKLRNSIWNPKKRFSSLLNTVSFNPYRILHSESRSFRSFCHIGVISRFCYWLTSIVLGGAGKPLWFYMSRWQCSNKIEFTS